MPIAADGFPSNCGAAIFHGLFVGEYRSSPKDLKSQINRYGSKDQPVLFHKDIDRHPVGAYYRSCGVAITVPEMTGTIKALKEIGAVETGSFMNMNSKKRNTIWLIPLNKEADIKVGAFPT